MDEQLKSDFERFKTLTYEDFKKLAQDDTLSVYQKIGFPDAYRKEKEWIIYEDILGKLQLDEAEHKVILDIGPGCSQLSSYIIEYAQKAKATLLLADSKEMLDLLPDAPDIKKFPGYFPNETASLIDGYMGKVDYIICYSIFHYVFYNTCIFKFLDIAVSMLKPGGKILLGDLPNISKRKRFFSTPQGIQYHQQFTGTDTLPEITNHVVEPAQMDDGVIFSILQRYRNFGLETYLLPQSRSLPMWNRREDILIEKN